MTAARRRTVTVAAAALLLGLAAWIARDDAGSRGPSHATSPPRGLPGRTSGAATRDTPEAPRVPGRHERRRAQAEDPAPEVAVASDGPPGRPQRAPSPVGKTFEGDARLEGQIVPNLRPAVRPGEAPRVLARDWHPAQESLAVSSARTPNLAVTGEAPDAATPTADASARRRDEEEVALAQTHGLRGDYFDFLEGWLQDIPDLSKLPPSFTRIDLSLDFDTDESFALPFEPDTFAVRWTGYLDVPEEADWRFVCGSDDGARVLIDGKAVIDQPRLRPYAESSGTAPLTAGAHPIEVLFYENYGYASCRLWWSGPSWTRRIVAPQYLRPPNEFAGVVPPVIASVDRGAGFVEDTVTIRGAGLPPSPSLARVTFGNVPAEIVSTSPDRVVVKVPVGAATGDVVVQTGALSSLPMPFTVRNLLGLYSEYFKLDGQILEYPDHDRLAPYFVRLDPRLDFLDDNLWKLPYDPDVFASRHTGFLYIPEEDDYRITLGSDDGARVTLDGRPWLDMPGLHHYTEQTKTARLAKGFHPIEVIFFENHGLARLALYWQRASEASRTVIPKGFFWAPRELSDLPVPQVASLAPKAGEIGGEIEIAGSGFGADPRLVRVVFPGDVWVRPVSVADDRVRVRVPYGCEAGDLRVEVGIQTSNAVPFKLATQQGLTAEYFAFSDRASLERVASPDALAKLAANVTRIETGWQRTTLKDWALPFPADAMAVHWHGTLAVEYPTDVQWILRTAAGGWLFVDGQIANDCGPWHELEERYGGSHLTPGEHAFDLWLVQAGAEPRLQLLYTPTGRLDHLPVPARWFLPRDPRPGK